jgi:hypothetical protein
MDVSKRRDQLLRKVTNVERKLKQGLAEKKRAFAKALASLDKSNKKQIVTDRKGRDGS